MWRVYDELFAVVTPWLEGTDPADDLVRQSMSAAVNSWERYGDVAGAMLENVATSPEIAQLWADLVERAAEALAAKIEEERSRGAAPPGPDPRVIAAILTHGSQNILYAGGLGLHEELPSTRATLDPLTDLWFGAVYGHAPRTSR